MTRTSCTACLALALGLLGGAARAADVVERRAVVPEPERPHGEVRVVLRDGATIVQTVIYSRSVRRVAGAIAEKEQANWPRGREGAAEAARYVEALAAIAAAVRDAPAGEDRRRGLCIEFPASGPVTLSGALVDRTADGLRLVEPIEPATALNLDRAYVGRNRVLIVADAFGVDEPTAAGWLHDAGTTVAMP